MNKKETRKRVSKARRWVRRLLLVIAIPVILLLVWIVAGIPAKVRYERVMRKMLAAQELYEGKTSRETSRENGHEEVTLRTESRNGDYIIKHQPDDYFVSMKRGNERLEYCPSWGVAYRWTEKETRSEYRYKESLKDTLLSAWLNPLVSVRTRRSGQDLVLTHRRREVLDVDYRYTATAKFVLDAATFRPKTVVSQTRSRHGERLRTDENDTEWLEWHKSLPANTFSIPLRENTVMLNERIHNIIQSDEEGGRRMSVFECSQDESGTLLIGFAPCSFMDFGGVAITDVSTGKELGPPLYDRYTSWWGSGASDSVALLCPRPTSVPRQAVHKLRIEVYRSVFMMSGLGSRYTFKDVPVTKSFSPVYPECNSPPWSKRWAFAERPQPAHPAD